MTEPLFKVGELAFIATEMDNPAVPTPLIGHVLKYNSVVEIVRCWEVDYQYSKHRYEIKAFQHSIAGEVFEPVIGERRTLIQTVSDKDLTRHKIPVKNIIDSTLPYI